MRLLTAVSLAAALSTGSIAVAANTMTPASAAKPAAKPAPAAPKPTISDDKKAVSKACSDQANTKNLHGKARKAFRNKCKTAGKG